MKPLDLLREKVSEIDKEIIKLIGKRIELTKEIGQEKKEKSIPLRNWDVEKAVIENAMELAAKIGISPAFIKSFMQQIIMESRIQQEILHYSTYEGDKENVLIVGVLGEMGKWFSDFFQNQGHNVSVYDTKGKSDSFTSYCSLEDGIKDASCALIATPLEAVPEVIIQLSELNFQGIVFDIASFKGYLKGAIQQANDHSISITSIHPMFGPNVRTLSDKVICFCDCGNKWANQKVESFFKSTAASTVRLSLDEHDRIISYVLGLSHIINIIFIKVLTEGGYQYTDLKQIASTTFLSQMVTASSVIKENPNLYYTIQKLNPYKKDLFKKITNTVEQIIDIVLSDNKEKFIEIMERGENWLGQE